MSKREPTRIHVTKVKKRRGVGSRVITVIGSDKDEPALKASSDYARMTKTRVASSAKAEKVSMTLGADHHLPRVSIVITL